MKRKQQAQGDSPHYWIVGLFEDGPWIDGAYTIRPEGAARFWSRKHPGVPVVIFGGSRIEAYCDGEPMDPRPLLRGRILGDRPPEIEDDRQYYYPRAR